MNDRDLQVLEQYPFTVRGSFRVRGAFLLDTSEGRRLIREYSGSVQKLETEQKAAFASSGAGVSGGPDGTGSGRKACKRLAGI